MSLKLVHLKCASLKMSKIIEKKKGKWKKSIRK